MVRTPKGPRFLGKPLLICLGLLLSACATSPLGRSQLQLFSEQEMQAMGGAAFAEMRHDAPVTDSVPLDDYVHCVAAAITKTLPQGGTAWEVVVFDDDQANAFALPGGKIGVYAGLLEVADNQDQLAAVIGHEIGHVQAHHANERVSTSALTQVGMQVISTISGSASPQRDRAMAALGLGVQVGVLLPFSRTQETEADLIGLDLMARAGFNPEASVTLWQNMARQSSGAPPELLSTHPASQTRIANLQAHMPQALVAYHEAREQGRVPACDDLHRGARGAD